MQTRIEEMLIKENSKLHEQLQRANLSYYEEKSKSETLIFAINKIISISKVLDNDSPTIIDLAEQALKDIGEFHYDANESHAA